MASTLLPLATFLLVLSASYLQIAGAETQQKLPTLKLNSKILQESIAKEINENPEAGWEAAINPRFSNYTVEQFKRLLGVKPMPQKELRSTPTMTHPKSLKLPKNFDARTAWSQCSTIGRILDQGHCGSCWAFGAVESLSDRFCIHFDLNISLSVNDLLACCGFLCGSGCDGGYPLYAWRYLAHHGVVTEECDPYFDQIGCSHPGCEPAYRTPKCVKKCVSGNQVWKKSKHYSVNAYTVSSDPHDIMAEVYKNGPVEVAFTVYEFSLIRLIWLLMELVAFDESLCFHKLPFEEACSSYSLLCHCSHLLWFGMYTLQWFLGAGFYPGMSEATGLHGGFNDFSATLSLMYTSKEKTYKMHMIIWIRWKRSWTKITK